MTKGSLPVLFVHYEKIHTDDDNDDDDNKDNVYGVDIIA